MSTAATYVYCVVQSSGPPGLEGVPAGLPGLAPPRLLELGHGLWLVVADAPLPEYGSAQIEQGLGDVDWISTRALAHEGVVESFAGRAATLPMKIFTLFGDDGRALAHLGEERGKVERALTRTAGRFEWGVRILFDEARARRAAAARREETATSGTAFLVRKKQEQDRARSLAGRARTEAERLFAELARRASAARRREPPEGLAGARLLLDAAFLVPVAEAEGFEGAVAMGAELLAGHSCEVTLTGPWPPYNFIEETG